MWDERIKDRLGDTQDFPEVLKMLINWLATVR